MFYELIFFEKFCPPNFGDCKKVNGLFFTQNSLFQCNL